MWSEVCPSVALNTESCKVCLWKVGGLRSLPKRQVCFACTSSVLLTCLQFCILFLLVNEEVCLILSFSQPAGTGGQEIIHCKVRPLHHCLHSCRQGGHRVCALLSWGGCWNTLESYPPGRSRWCVAGSHPWLCPLLRVSAHFHFCAVKKRAPD